MVFFEYQILAQAFYDDATNHLLFTVPAGLSLVVSKLNIASLGGDCYFRVFAVPSGQELEEKHTIAFDVLLGVREATAVLQGATLIEGDSIYVHAIDGVAFSLFGKLVPVTRVP